MTDKKEIIKIDPGKEIKNYANFAFKGRLVEMAVAFIIGASFEKVVRAISQNLLMPILNYFIGKADEGGNWRETVFTPISGLSIEVGEFLGSFVDFIIISIILYVLYVKLFQHFVPDATKLIPCRFCLTPINAKCLKCPSCTANLSKPHKTNKKIE